MRNYSILILLSFLIFKSIFAQKINWGPLQVSEQLNFTPNFIGEDQDRIYAFYQICDLCKKIRVQSYSKSSLSLIYDIESPNLNNPSGDDIKLEDASFLNNNLILFGFRTKKNDLNPKKIIKTSLIATSAEYIDGKLQLSPFKELLSLNQAKFLGFKMDKWIKKHESPDKSKVLYVYKTIDEKSNKIILMFKLFNSKLELIEEFEEIIDDYNTSSLSGGIDFNKILVDNDGSIYYLSKFNSIISLDANKGFERWEEKITIENMAPEGFIDNINFCFDYKGNVNAFGLYYESKEKKELLKTVYEGGLAGIFYLKLDYLTKEILFSKMSRLPDRLKNVFPEQNHDYVEKKDKRLGMNISNITLKPLINGGLVVTAEDKLNYDRSYYFGDMFIFKMDGNGNLNWSDYFKKKQMCQYNPVKRIENCTKYFGTLSLVKNNKLYIFYNNYKKNTPATPAKKLHTITDIAMSRFARIDIRSFLLESGKSEEKSLLNGLKTKPPWTTSIFYLSKDRNSFYTFGQRGKNFKMGEIRL